MALPVLEQDYVILEIWINMEKIFGITERNDQLIMFKNGAVLVFGFGEEDGEGYSYRQNFTHIPTKSEVLNIIFDHVNSLTDEKILSGFVWNGVNVWLSTENQFNFKAAYDVAVQTNGASLPVKFKLGEVDGVPRYYVFDNMATFTDFYTKAIAFIMVTLNDGWVEKDGAKLWVESLDLDD